MGRSWMEGEGEGLGTIITTVKGNKGLSVDVILTERVLSFAAV